MTGTGASPDDLLDHLAGGPDDLDVPHPKCTDIAIGFARIDPGMAMKRSDWTNAETPVRLTTR